LIKFGYQYRLSDRLRHAALEKAAKAYGPHRLVQMLTAVANLTVHTAPDAHKIFARDQDWVSEKFLKK
jgi:hypothetical protein